MGVVSAKEVAKVLNLENFGFLGTSIGWAILHTTRLSVINKEYDKRKHFDGVEFINSILERFEIDFEISEIKVGDKVRFSI